MAVYGFSFDKKVSKICSTFESDEGPGGEDFSHVVGRMKNVLVFVVFLMYVGHAWMVSCDKCDAIGGRLFVSLFEKFRTLKGGDFLENGFDERWGVATANKML